MPLVCPICYSEAQELEHTSDATGYSCPTHGNFKIAGSVFPEARAKDYTREEWEAALDKAKQRMEPEKGEEEEEKWPLIITDIITDDFY